MLTLSVGKTQHAATSAVTAMYGMDVALDTNSADTQLQATMALGGATVQVDNEMDGDNLETKARQLVSRDHTGQCLMVLDGKLMAT